MITLERGTCRHCTDAIFRRPGGPWLHVHPPITRLHEAEPAVDYCTAGTCTDDGHDHHEPDEVNGGMKPIRCADCGLPAHYDYRLERGEHDDPNAPACFLIRSAR